jgi:hypothetical protein
MIFLPWVLVVTVFIIYIFLGRFFHGQLGNSGTSKFMVFKSFLTGSFAIALISALADLILCESLLQGESGAFVLLFTGISIGILFLLSNLVFLTFLIVYKE